MDTEFLDWALADFSGYVAADELYDGPFCILSAVDNRCYKRILYDVLEAIRKPCSNVVPVSSSFLAIMKCRVTILRKPVQHKMYITNMNHSGT